jgi:phage major head subunit gpT-like protein
MRTEFLSSYLPTATPAPWESITQVIPSTARIERYTWMTPTPAMALYRGHRNYGNIGSVTYSVLNKEFDSAFEVPLRDVEDDQTQGFELKPQELAAKAKLFPGRWVMQHLALGASLNCFDATAFFANSHTVGTGDNLLAGTGSGNADGLSHKFVVLYTGGTLKPLIWQTRKQPNFQTNAGTPQSYEAKTLRYWIDMEGQAAYGWWWNAVQYTFTHLPTVSEIHDAFGSVEQAFRTFSLPVNLTGDMKEYMHEQTVFSAANTVVVHSTTLTHLMRQALNQDWVPQTIGATAVATTNRFQGWATYIPNRWMDPDVTVSTEGH